METEVLDAWVGARVPDHDGAPALGAASSALGAPELNFAALEAAAQKLRAGEIVAIPTETVYGLAANALDAVAVGKIYAAKGRPSNNPLIVHVSNIDGAKELVRVWPPEADLLAEAFWPGPLTLVLEKKGDVVPAITTAGGPTVAIRCPRHPVALEIIRLCGFPLAAPSANRSNAISPTTAQHVVDSLGGRIPLVLDGGPCNTGIESTVLDLTRVQPAILRPGVLSSSFLSEILQQKVAPAGAARVATDGIETGHALTSPGQLPVHYAPETPLWLSRDFGRIADEIREVGAAGRPSAALFFSDRAAHYLEQARSGGVAVAGYQMPDDPTEYARMLYARLHELDHGGFGAIFCEMPPDDPVWAGVVDRLSRAGKILLRTY